MYGNYNNSTVPELLCDECGNPVGHQYYIIPVEANVYRYLCPACDKIRNSHAERARLSALRQEALEAFEKETKEKLEEIKGKFIPACYHTGYNLDSGEVVWLMETVEHLQTQLLKKK